MPTRWNAQNLDEFVARCDAGGGLASSYFREAAADFTFDVQTQVDVSLDPFGDDYFKQQVAVYAEISGRALDQDTGEITPLDAEALSLKANPYGTRDTGFISKHARAVLTSVMVANLPEGARVLDMGAGWGLSSEMIAFSGAEVTAVDINPASVDLIKRRAARLGLPITAIEGNFDTVEPGTGFDMAFFYECLHHSVRPLETLKRVATFLGESGRIVFAGEPINTIWWPHWGMRLDAESVYVMRKFGWFESGWSEQFICDCLRRAGFEPVVIPQIGLSGGVICVADRLDAVDMPPLCLPPGAAQRIGSVVPASDELQTLRQQVAALTKERDHARRFPWKYISTAYRMRKG